MGRPLTGGPHHVDGAHIRPGDVVLHEGRQQPITRIVNADNPRHPDHRIAYINGDVWALLVPDDPYIVYRRKEDRKP